MELCISKVFAFSSSLVSNFYLNFQEREARIETKRRHDRSSIVFAFGSSTPRMLEPADTGGSYWASRRYLLFTQI